jgi:hypothetical protein
MEKKFKYDPEDIESLLMHKQFNELFEEEREFILQHIEGEEEYESLRKTLFELHDTSMTAEWLEPEPSIKEALMKEFAQEKKGSFRIWLNSLFVIPEIVWYRRPAIQVTFAGVCALIAVVFILKMENKRPDIASTKGANNSISTPTEIQEEGKNLFADNLQAKEFPPAPKATEIQQFSIPTTTNSDDVAEPMDEVKYVGAVVEESVSESAQPENENALTDISSKNYKKTEDMDSPFEDKLEEKDNAAVSKSPTVTSENLNQTLSSSQESVTLVSTNSGAASYNWIANTAASASMSEVKDLFVILYTAP